jgi:hypothetical protein
MVINERGHTMKTKRAQPKQEVESGGKIYTYNVICSFNLQYSFTESEVENDPGGAETDFNPTDKALKTLEKDLRETLGQNYAVSNLEAYAESDSLLGITEEDSLPKKPGQAKRT